MKTKLALMALALMWAAPASAQMEARCALIKNDAGLEVRALVTEPNFDIVVAMVAACCSSGRPSRRCSPASAPAG
jgi:hypothetical protein